MYFQKYKSDFEKKNWKAEDLYFRLVTFLGCVCWTQKSPERNMWKIVDFQKIDHFLGGWEKIPRKFFRKKKFGDHNSIHKLSKKSNRKRFYRGSSEKPASQEHRDFTYPPPCNQLADPKLLGDPPSRADSCTCTRVPVRIILIIIVPINSVKKLLPVSNLGSNFKMT